MPNVTAASRCGSSRGCRSPTRRGRASGSTRWRRARASSTAVRSSASALDSGVPLLIAQCDHPLVLSDVKLALLDRRPPETSVTVLQRVGLPDEHVDRAVARRPRPRRRARPPHVGLRARRRRRRRRASSRRLLALAERLRRPGGCPWDAEQTHHSLTRYLLEESYEVVEAVEALPPHAPDGVAPDDPAYVALVDELGDLLYQVIFHAVLADEAGAFDMADVARGIHDKLVRRHPHVFGDVDGRHERRGDGQLGADQEGGEGRRVDRRGITPGLPSLLYAHKLLSQGRVGRPRPGRRRRVARTRRRGGQRRMRARECRRGARAR